MKNLTRIAVVPLAVVVAAGVGGGAFAVGRSLTAGDVPEAVTYDGTFQALLTGDQESAGGDPDGTGSIGVRIDPDTDQVCIDVLFQDLDDLTGLHLHRGGPGQDGPVVVDFGVAGPSTSMIVKCVAAGAVTDEIIANPIGFYVNAHTTAFPNGAVRGQVEPQITNPYLLPTPVRAFDSRQPNTPGVPALGAGTTTTVDLASVVPPTAVAAMVTVTVTETTGAGYLSVYSAALGAVPATSTINWTAPGSDVATTTTVKLSPSGAIKITTGPNGGADVIVDVIGYLA